MEILQTGIQGLIQLVPKVHQDSRGWFAEIYKSSDFQKACGGIGFVQDNISFSKKNVLRGLHLQIGDSAQAKVVMVLLGRVLDVVVDVRRGSSTFGKSYQLELNSASRNMLFIPEGFAHGFSAIEESIFLYKCSKEYQPSSETGIIWNDTDLNVNWQNPNPIISDKDTTLPSFQDLLRNSVISQH